jgi:hypothetical protein
MTRHQFSTFVRYPETLDQEALKALDQVVGRFPYCQDAQYLLAVSVKEFDHLRYPGQLKRTAACAGDRNSLRQLLTTQLVPVNPMLESGEPDAGMVSVADEEITPALPIMEEDFGAVSSAELDSLPPIESEEPGVTFTWEFSPKTEEHSELPTEPEHFSPEELLAIVHRRLAEISAEEEKSHPQEIISTEKVTSGMSSSAASTQDIVDRFIREEPRISRPDVRFYSPSDESWESSADSEDIVSETLAMLYAEQGHLSKAISIYEKLSLLNQEKSRYFAAQIKKLKS